MASIMGRIPTTALAAMEVDNAVAGMLGLYLHIIMYLNKNVHEYGSVKREREKIDR